MTLLHMSLDAESYFPGKRIFIKLLLELGADVGMKCDGLTTMQRLTDVHRWFAPSPDIIKMIADKEEEDRQRVRNPIGTVHVLCTP